MRRAPFIALPLDHEPFVIPAQLGPQDRVIWLKAARLGADRLPLTISKPDPWMAIRDRWRRPEPTAWDQFVAAGEEFFADRPVIHALASFGVLVAAIIALFSALGATP